MKSMKRFKIPKGSYVYFLVSDDKIVYIGQSKWMIFRIGCHQMGLCNGTDKKEFDEVYYMKVSEKDIDEVEKFYIDFFRPYYNATYRRFYHETDHQRHIREKKNANARKNYDPIKERIRSKIYREKNKDVITAKRKEREKDPEYMARRRMQKKQYRQRRREAGLPYT